MKTKEELNALKQEIDTLSKKLRELTAEELELVTGGKKEAGVSAGSKTSFPFDAPSDQPLYNNHIYLGETIEDAKRKFLGN